LGITGNLLRTRKWDGGSSVMKRPAEGFSNGSIGFELEGLLDLGLLASAGEKRSWNWVILAICSKSQKCKCILEDLRNAGSKLEFRRMLSLQTLEQP
jgi:hypothetical protein